MSLYIDASALLKVFFAEPESTRTCEILAREPRVVVSSLARLESLIVVRSRERSGLLTAEAARRLAAQIEARLLSAPFEFRACPATIIEAAEQQIARSEAYCPTLDRLHLAAMEVMGLKRLLTNDTSQAAAARALGYEVLMPR